MNLLYAFYYTLYGYFAIPGFSVLINGILLALAAIVAGVIIYIFSDSEE